MVSLSMDSPEMVLVERKKHSFKGRILAVIPCLNEEKTIKTIIGQTKPHVDTILIIDDGSTDNTAHIARQAGATVISHTTNQGKGTAIKTGFTYAKNHHYDYVVTLDGDGQHNPHEIPHLLNAITNNTHDISLGFRTGNTTEMPTWRKIGKRILDYITSLGNGGFLTDSQCGFRAFNKKAIHALTPDLKEKSFGIESEQLVKAHDHHLRLTNIKISCKYQNLPRTSTKHPVTHALTVLLYIGRHLVLRHPFSCLVIPGFVLVSLGMISTGCPLHIIGWTSVASLHCLWTGATLMASGMFVFCMGLLVNCRDRRCRNQGNF
jgi:glycosyltransferase involved in cell wall biosynthesis